MKSTADWGLGGPQRKRERDREKGIERDRESVRDRRERYCRRE